MKIIVANYRYFVAGGPEKYMFKFMEAAMKRGIEVIPFSVQNSQNEYTPYEKYFAKPRSSQLMYADTKKNFKNMVSMIRAAVWNYDASRRLRLLIRETKPDVIYILHEVNHLSPSIIRTAKKEGIKVVHRISDFFMFCPKYDFLCKNEICESCINGKYKKAIAYRCVKDSLFATLLRVFAMKIYKYSHVFDDVDHFICTCEFSKQKLIQGGISAHRITCIPTFIDASKVTPQYTNEGYFLFLGRMAHQKGTIYAIKAMNHLKNYNCVLKITGTLSNSDEDNYISDYIKEHHLEKKVEFTGFLKGQELEDLIKNAICIVCPAIWYENMPNTVIEAYSYGKPVVASRIGSLEEIVEDNKTGLLFEMKNSIDLAQKLESLLKNSQLSSNLGKNARLKCDSEYSEESHFTKLLPIFETNNNNHENS